MIKSKAELKMAHKNVKIPIYEDVMVNIKEEMEVNEGKEEEHNGIKHEFEAKLEPEELDYAHDYLQKLFYENGEVKIKKEIEVNEEDEDSEMENRIEQELGIRSKPTMSCNAPKDCHKSVYEDVQLKLEELEVKEIHFYKAFEMNVKEEILKYEEPVGNVLEDMSIKSNDGDEQLCGKFPIENDELSCQWNKSIINNAGNMVNIKKESVFSLDFDDKNDYFSKPETLELANKRSCEEENSDTKCKKIHDIQKNNQRKHHNKQGRPCRKKRGTIRMKIDYNETVENSNKRGRSFKKKRGRPRKKIDYNENVEAIHFKRKRGRPRKMLEDGEIRATRSYKYKSKIDPYSLLSDKEILARNPCPTLKQVKICVDRLSPKSFLNSISNEIPGINTESIRNICKQLIKMRRTFREKFIKSQKRYIRKNRGVLPKIDCTDLVDPKYAIGYNDTRKEKKKQNSAISSENGTNDLLFCRDSELISGNKIFNVVNEGHPSDVSFHKSSSPKNIPITTPTNNYNRYYQHMHRTMKDSCYSPIVSLDHVNNDQSTPMLSDKDPFICETDNFQSSPSPFEDRIKLPKSSGLLKHSTPVVEFQSPFIPTFMGEKKLHLFHKQPIKRYSHGPLASPISHQVHTLTEEIKKKAKIRKLWRFSSLGDDIFFMQTPEDLTGKDGDIIMVEYSEEHPPFLSQVGMCTLIKNYYNWQTGMDKYPPNYRYGGTCFLQNPPFLASVHPGESIQTMENNMYRSPIYEHKMPLTDFLIIRSRSGYYIREIDALFTSGQQYPLYEAPTPNSKPAITFTKTFLQVFIYNLFWKSNDTPRKIKMDKIKQAFPAHSENYIRKCLKPIADFKRTHVDSNWWVIKPDFELPSKDEISAMVSPEQCCAFFAMAAAQQKLMDAGYGDNFHLSLDDDNEDETERLEYEIKVAPWHPVTPYVQAVRGRGLLQLTAFADPKEKTKEDKKEKKKVSFGNGFYFSEQQESYKEECQKIFDHQNRVLASSDVLLTDEGELEDEDDDSDSEDTMKCFENKFVNKKASTQMASDKEELENKEKNKQQQDIKNKDSDFIKMVKREDGRVLRISRTYISSEGKKYTRTELVRKNEVIDAYVKIRTLKDDSFIKFFTEDFDENQKEEMKRERRRIQEKLRRIKRNQEREEKGIVHPPKIKKAKFKPDLKLTCGACGQVGHMRTNKACSLYVGFSQFGTENEKEIEKPTLNESEELVVVDGTKIKISSKVIKYAEELKKHSLVLNSHKIQIKKPKRRRAGTSDHCDYLNRKEKPINRRRVDPLVTLSSNFEEILNELREMPGADPFIFPVNQKEVPDYYNIITNPMDLLTIRQNLHLKKYQNRKEFLGDISQIVENSKVYNGHDSKLTATSKKMLDICINSFSKKKEKLIHLEKSINPLLDDEQVAFDFILTQIMNERLFTNQVSWPFMKPVNKKTCKDYYKIIHHPMDLSKIERKIKSHRYHKRADFMADIELIEINAIKYNGIESTFTKKAQALTQITKASLEEWDSDLEKLENALPLAQECALEQTDTNSLNNSLGPDDTNNNFTESKHKQEEQAQQNALSNATLDHSC